MFGLKKEVNRNGVISRMIRFVFDFDADTRCEFFFKGLWVCYLVPLAIVAVISPILAGLEIVGCVDKMVVDNLFGSIIAGGMGSFPFILAIGCGLMMGFLLCIVAFLIPTLGTINWLFFLATTGEWNYHKQLDAFYESKYLPWFENSFVKWCKASQDFKEKYCKTINYK